MWTEKRLLKALASDFKEAIQSIKEEIEQTQREATDLIIRAKTKHTGEIIEKRRRIEICRKEINDYMALVDYMSNREYEIPEIYGVSPLVKGTPQTWSDDLDSLVSDRITVVMSKKHQGSISGYFAMTARMSEVFDNDSSKLTSAYLNTVKSEGQMELLPMINNLIMYHFLRKQFVRLRGNQAVNYIRNFSGETIVLGDDLNRPYVIRKIIIEKVKKTKKGKVTMCHLHMNRADNGCSDSITINICHKDSYYRDDGRRHFWAKTKSGFHPVICVDRAIFKKSFEEFVAGY